MSVAPALQLNPSEATRRHSTTSTGHLCSIGTWSQSKPLWSTLLLNCPPLASTHARYHSVAASQAPGSIYASISWCSIPRILCAFQLRVPSPYPSGHNVACRRRWRTSTEVITAQGCVRGEGVGEEVPTFGGCAFPASPQTYVHSVRGGAGESEEFQVPGAANCLQCCQQPGHAEQPEKGTRVLGLGLPCAAA
jgi:hypothetical protein